MTLPVAIVGGGPVGLATAVDLGWHGIDCVLIEQGDGTVDNAKFVDINMRTMEFCRRWGIAEEVRDRGFNPAYPQDLIVVTSLSGYELARQPFPAFSDFRTPPVTAERIARCPQTVFDPILRRLAAASPRVRLRYGTHCERVTQDATGATLELVDVATGTRERLRVSYVTCCEGAGSQIRETLGITLDGGTLSYNANVVFRSDELLHVHDKGPGFYTAIGPEGRWASILAIDGRSLWRLQLTQPVDRATFDRNEAALLIRRFVGCDFPFEVVSALVWARREVVAQRYQDARIFLLGDAAHQLSPAGGFGLNTGIGDVTNLTWKLAAMVRGWAGDALLASYDDERRPIGMRNVRAATARWNENQGRAVPGPTILAAGPEGERVRAAVRHDLQPWLDRVNCGYELGARYEDAGLQLGYRYDGSPLVVSDGTPPPPDDVRTYTPTSYPGARAPHFWLEPERSILDLFGRGFVLLRLAPDAPPADRFVAAAAERGVPFAVHTFDIPQLLHTYNRRAILVRPDGHVAWRSDDLPADPGGILDVAVGGKSRC